MENYNQLSNTELVALSLQHPVSSDEYHKVMMELDRRENIRYAKSERKFMFALILPFIFVVCSALYLVSNALTQ